VSIDDIKKEAKDIKDIEIMYKSINIDPIKEKAS